jgi:hypothetical protein
MLYKRKNMIGMSLTDCFILVIYLHGALLGSYSQRALTRIDFYWNNVKTRIEFNKEETSIGQATERAWRELKIDIPLDRIRLRNYDTLKVMSINRHLTPATLTNAFILCYCCDNRILQACHMPRLISILLC